MVVRELNQSQNLSLTIGFLELATSNSTAYRATILSPLL